MSLFRRERSGPRPRAGIACVMIHDHGEIADRKQTTASRKWRLRPYLLLRTQSCGSFGKRLGYLAAQLFNCC